VRQFRSLAVYRKVLSEMCASVRTTCALLCELPLTQAYSTDQRVAAQGLIEVNIAKPIDVTRPPNSIIEAENVAGVRIWVRSDFR
jgi:hypothetical protein